MEVLTLSTKIPTIRTPKDLQWVEVEVAVAEAVAEVEAVSVARLEEVTKKAWK